MGKRIVIYTTTWCPDCRAAKKNLAPKNLPYEEIDIEGTIVSGDQFHPSRFEKDLRAAGAL